MLKGYDLCVVLNSEQSGESAGLVRRNMRQASLRFAEIWAWDMGNPAVSVTWSRSPGVIGSQLVEGEENAANVLLFVTTFYYVL